MNKNAFFLLLLLFFVSCINTDFREDNDKFFGSHKKIEVNEELTMKNESNWYQNAVFYHIWVKSFSDSDGDGVGDIQGIIGKLDYLADLGISGIWLSPIFDCDYKSASPKENMHGYDTINYYKINPYFGNESDVKELLEEAHKRGIRVIFDYVINHTSDKHPWFKNARNGGDKKDWYIWDVAPSFDWERAWGGGNWKSVWHRHQDEYYYGAFWSGMPDLNLYNRYVREEIANIGIYWLNMGFDGVRIDAVRYLIEDGPDKPADADDTHFFFKRLRKDILDKYTALGSSKMMVGEAWTSKEKIKDYYGNGNDEFHMAFDFPLSGSLKGAVRHGHKSETRIRMFKNALKYEQENYPEGYVNAVFLSNHDEAGERPATEFKNDATRIKLASGLSILIPGTPFIYYGNEIGMPNGKLRGDMRMRTQIPWEVVALQNTKEDSILNFHKKIIKIKNENESLSSMKYKELNVGNDKIFAFARYTDSQIAVVIANLADEEKNVTVDLSILNPPSTQGMEMITEQKVNLENGAMQVNALNPLSLKIIVINK